MKINKEHLDFVSSQLSLDIESWGEPNSAGFYRPKLTDGSRDISAWVVSDSVIGVEDFSGKRFTKRFLNIQDKKIVKKLSREDENKYKEQRKKLETEQKDKFLKIFDNIKPIKSTTCEVLKTKKIKIPKESQAFVSKDIKFSDTQKTPIKDGLVVPFYSDIEQTDLCGAQVRFSNKKYSVTGSRLSGAFHVLQKGEPIQVINQTPVYLAESFTTACEISEAAPKAGVVCVAGLSQVIPVYNKLLSELDSSYIILALDKTKYNTHNKAQQELEEEVVNEKIPHIQLSKVDKNALDMTDFNDYALAFGKTEVKKEIDLQSRQVLPLAPEVLNLTKNGYNVVSAITQTVVEVQRDRILNDVFNVATQAYIISLLDLYKIKADNNHIKQFLNSHFQSLALKNAEARHKGVGIFKDKESHVANLAGGRYVNNGECYYTLDFRPCGENVYVKNPYFKDLPDLISYDFNKGTLKEISSIWKELYNLDSSYLLALLGFIAQGAYSSFSPHRAHMWVTGTSGSGKSFLIKEIMNPLSQGFSAMLQNITEGGLNQYLTPEDGSQNSMLLMLDESASDTPSKEKRMAEIIALSREMATNDGNTISLRGTKDQNVKIYRRNCSMVMVSTTHSLVDLQDISRFVFLHLENNAIFRDSKSLAELRQRIMDVSPCFLRGIILSSRHFEKVYRAVLDIITDKVGVGSRDLSHKIPAITSIVAGAAALLMEANKWSADKAAEKTVEFCSRFIEYQVQKHKETLTQGDNMADAILRTRVNFMGDTIRLLTLLSNADTNKEYYIDYGIKCSRGKTIHINVTNFKLNKLTSNTRLTTNPFWCNQSTLVDLAASNCPGIRLSTLNCPVTKKRSRFVVVDIPDIYKKWMSEDHE